MYKSLLVCGRCWVKGWSLQYKKPLEEELQTVVVRTRRGNGAFLRAVFTLDLKIFPFFFHGKAEWELRDVTQLMDVALRRVHGRNAASSWENTKPNSTHAFPCPGDIKNLAITPVGI